MATSEKTSSYRWVIEVLLVLALASQARGCPWALKLGLKTELELPVCEPPGAGANSEPGFKMEIPVQIHSVVRLRGVGMSEPWTARVANG